ncbi:DUF305 domain-containing protein [Luteibacter yeojuensis]|uniref:DUF305 domain-containing protein n=1 Tax=Luteibacter yeojuensis TaxID=345309 RepID=A0A0F3KVM2_9GAMM|nr:DUF305 domain-containing protein [Luteibacter yeojuensis]KJV35201.1 hypothetical protein VI08_08975 [Luteibacter yeojuensis]
MYTARSCVVALTLLVALCGGSGSTNAGPQGDGFRAVSDHAMATMMKGMDVPPSGDVDHDFVAMMVPHHQGAIDMAMAELTYGKDERLRRIAQEIIVDQQQEIAAMRLALGQPLPPSAPAPTTAMPGQPPARQELP